jgi:hypothetical protein
LTNPKRLLIGLCLIRQGTVFVYALGPTALRKTETQKLKAVFARDKADFQLAARLRTFDCLVGTVRFVPTPDTATTANDNARNLGDAA